MKWQSQWRLPQAALGLAPLRVNFGMSGAGHLGKW
jgi:hypothetical protein